MAQLTPVTLGMRVFRKIRTPLIVMAIVAALPASFYFLRDQSNKPLCNKQTFFQVMNWFDNKKPKDLPNVNGSSSESLIQLKKNAYDNEKDFKEEINKWNEKYQYVPGLRSGDPGDLVLMYMKNPTRWLHHAATPRSIFSEAKWCVVSLDFGDTWRSWSTRVQRTIPEQSECAENVSSAEFASRLRKTLDFLREHDRPNWQTVVAENEALLKSIENQ